jgi:hypothetical protein
VSDGDSGTGKTNGRHQGRNKRLSSMGSESSVDPSGRRRTISERVRAAKVGLYGFFEVGRA